MVMSLVSVMVTTLLWSAAPAQTSDTYDAPARRSQKAVSPVVPDDDEEDSPRHGETGASTRGFPAALGMGAPVMPSVRTFLAGTAWGGFGAGFFGLWALLLLAAPITVGLAAFYGFAFGFMTFFTVSFYALAGRAYGGILFAVPAAVVAGLVGLVLGAVIGAVYSCWYVIASAVAGGAVSSVAGMVVDTMERIMAEHAPAR